MRKFISYHTPLSVKQQIIPRMPFTTLSLSDIDFIEKILTFQVGDLWVRRFDLGESNFTDAEFTALVTLGNELMGKAAYQTYSLTTKDISRTEQATADPLMIAFKDKYRENVEIATMPLMPYTTLTVAESKRI